MLLNFISINLFCMMLLPQEFFQNSQILRLKSVLRENLIQSVFTFQVLVAQPLILFCYFQYQTNQIKSAYASK